MVVRVACGLGVYGDGVSGLLFLPLLDQAVDCVDQATLGDRVEEETRSSFAARRVMSGGT